MQTGSGVALIINSFETDRIMFNIKCGYFTLMHTPFNAVVILKFYFYSSESLKSWLKSEPLAIYIGFIC